MVGEEEAAGDYISFFLPPRSSFPDTWLYYHSSSPVFYNCTATTSVWFGRLHQKLAVTGGMLLPVCLLRACPHMYLWHIICQVWCWNGKGLATVTWMCSVCLGHLKFVFKAKSLADLIKNNFNSFSRHVTCIYAAFSLLSRPYKKPKNVGISLDDDDDIINYYYYY